MAAIAYRNMIETKNPARLPGYSLAWLSGLLVERVLEGLGWDEGQLLGRSYLDRRPGRWIVRLALRGMLDLELSKAGEGRLVTGHGGLDNRSDHRLDDRLALCLGKAVFRRDLVGDFIGRGHFSLRITNNLKSLTA